jgi:diguanylate cyclase (GGDEF)-like protein
MAKMPIDSSAKTFRERLINFVTFTDLPMRKKFLLFSIGTLFWLVVISAIGFITLFSLNRDVEKLVDVVGPHEKALNSVVRKIRGATISAYKIAHNTDIEIINAHFQRARVRHDDCRLTLNILLAGGTVKDVSRAAGESYDEYFVKPVTDASKKTQVQEAVASLERLDSLLNDIHRLKEKNVRVTNELEEKVLEYDELVKGVVVTLTKFAISSSKEWDRIAEKTRMGFKISLVLIIMTFTVASALSLLFAYLIARNLVRPLNEISQKFRAFSSQEKEAVTKLPITSRDEIGELANEYNQFMDTINVITSFKKVIEEDENVDDVYIRLSGIFKEELGFNQLVIYEISTFKNNLKCVQPPDVSREELPCKIDILLDCDLCRVKRTGHLVSSVDYPQICKYFKEETGRMHICIPIVISGKVGGVVHFNFTKEETLSSEMDMKIKKAQQYIREAQPVLEAKRLMRAFKESSIRDALTGLYNRRFLEETSENIIAGLQRRGSVLGLLMCDLDFFKEVNDKYGHDVGDRVLRETAKIIKENVRSSDLVIRFGGEEFLVLLSDVRVEDSMQVAQKIREKMEKMKINIAGGIIQKNISIGISEFPKDTQNFWEAIKFADVALYKAKGAGRNKAIRFTEDMWTGEQY